MFLFCPSDMVAVDQKLLRLAERLFHENSDSFIATDFIPGIP